MGCSSLVVCMIWRMIWVFSFIHDRQALDICSVEKRIGAFFFCVHVHWGLEINDVCMLVLSVDYSS